MAAGRLKHPPIGKLLGLEVVGVSPGFLSCRAVPPAALRDEEGGLGEVWASAAMSAAMTWLLRNLLDASYSYAPVDSTTIFYHPITGPKSVYGINLTYSVVNEESVRVVAEMWYRYCAVKPVPSGDVAQIETYFSIAKRMSSERHFPRKRG